jgi:hypothetical protein
LALLARKTAPVELTGFKSGLSSLEDAGNKPLSVNVITSNGGEPELAALADMAKQPITQALKTSPLTQAVRTTAFNAWG